jgi:hypothetical protein
MGTIGEGFIFESQSPQKDGIKTTESGRTHSPGFSLPKPPQKTGDYDPTHLPASAAAPPSPKAPQKAGD